MKQLEVGQELQVGDREWLINVLLNRFQILNYDIFGYDFLLEKKILCIIYVF